MVKLGSSGFAGYAVRALPGSELLQSGPEDMDGSDDVLAADRTLAHPLAALGAGDHVTALQQDTVNGRVHADPTEVLLQTCRTATGLWRETQTKTSVIQNKFQLQRASVFTNRST